MGAIFLVSLVSLSAVQGGSGLEAVAVSGDGKSLAVAGQNRVVYVLDAQTLQVKRRLPVRTRVGGLAFTPDGTGLLVEDETDVLRLIDAVSGKERGRVADVSGLIVASGGDVVAVRDLARLDKPGVRLLRGADLKELASCVLTERAAAFAFSGEGKRLVVLEDGYESDEKRVPLGETPTELKGLARLEFQQKNDGRSSWLRTFEVPSGKELSRVALWYTTGSLNTRLGVVDKEAVVVNRINVCARIGAKGETTLFQVGERGPMAVAFSGDGKALWLGGRAGGSVGGVEGKRGAFVLEELPGQAEFVTRLVERDGVGYGVTSAFRVFRVEKGAVKVAAVY